MKTTKLVVGIMMIVLAAFILFQSSAVGLGNALANNGETSGSSGFLVAVLYLATGIVYIVTRKREGLGGDIAGLIMMLICGLMGFNAGSYSDLVIWSVLAVIIGTGFFICHLAVRDKNE